jgi:hypothetical protein
VEANSKRNASRVKYAKKHAIPEVWQALEDERISIDAADRIAHSPKNGQMAMLDLAIKSKKPKPKPRAKAGATLPRFGCRACFCALESNHGSSGTVHAEGGVKAKGIQVLSLEARQTRTRVSYKPRRGSPRLGAFSAKALRLQPCQEA